MLQLKMTFIALGVLWGGENAVYFFVELQPASHRKSINYFPFAHVTALQRLFKRTLREHIYNIRSW